MSKNRSGTIKAPKWFLKFDGIGGDPFITSICDWTKGGVAKRADKEIGPGWRKLGYRIKRVNITEKS